MPFATDSVSLRNGQILFAQQCSGCHNFIQNGLGPQLGGITKVVSPEWLHGFIHNPDSILQSADERGKKLATDYKIPMPAFQKLSSIEIHQIISYIHLQKGNSQLVEDGESLKDPIPYGIDSSNLITPLEFITQIAASDDAPLLTRITKLDGQPGSDDLFILDLRGKLYRVSKGKSFVYMDISVLEKDFINTPGLATGFGSFAFHPEFVSNGLLYTSHSERTRNRLSSHKIDFDYPDSIPAAMQWVVMEWKTKNPERPDFKGIGRVLFRINMVTGIHGVQELAFNPTAKKGDGDYGLLYVGIGDGGAVENRYTFLAHSKSKLWGTIIRIDPLGRNSKNGNYGIPAGNPFANDKDSHALQEIYAFGFRNPHRLSWTKEGQLLTSNIGHSQIDALDLVVPGGDYGWPIREGTFLVNPAGDIGKVYPLPTDDQNFHITYPVAQFDHSEGKAISGGFEYAGAKAPQLAGKFLFGDIVTGNLFYVEVSDLKLGSQAKILKWQVSLNGKVRPLSEICGSKRVDLHFGKDTMGDLYVLTKPDGKVYRLIQ